MAGDLKAFMQESGDYITLGRPVIELKAGELDRAATEAEQALIAAGVEIFRRGSVLVRPVTEEIGAAHGRRTKAAALIPVSVPWLRDQLCEHADFKRWNVKKKALASVDPPFDVVTTVLARYGAWRFRPVSGIITAPTLRPDASILDTPGYDAATHLFLASPPPMPAIPARPTRDDALKAIALLDGLLEDFPFSNDASRSTAKSALLTTVCRAYFECSPLHGTTASTAGSGKSYLIDMAGAIASGERVPVLSAGSKPEEMDKRLESALLAGRPIISIDNVSVDLGSDTLCQAIERPVIDIRILGRSELVKIENSVTMFCSGNNLTLSGDMTRRALLISLDANVERPELREFRGDPFATVIADRGKYVAACLTIVRAFLVSGAQPVKPPLASFEGWSNSVRSALLWLGCPDPVATMEAARAEDPQLQTLSAVISCMEALDIVSTGNARTAAELIHLASERDGDFPGRGDLQHPELHAALLEAAGSKGRIDAKSLGKWLAKNKGRPVGGLRINPKQDDHGHAIRWSLGHV